VTRQDDGAGGSGSGIVTRRPELVALGGAILFVALGVVILVLNPGRNMTLVNGRLGLHLRGHLAAISGAFTCSFLAFAFLVLAGYALFRRRRDRRESQRQLRG
jgi:membrane protein implicated in regulation of membrane protease activity